MGVKMEEVELEQDEVKGWRWELVERMSECVDV